MSDALPPLRLALFDLDQTLYPMSSGLMAEISRLINAYMLERCGFGEAEIDQLRKTYYVRYGTTLRGLMLHHNVDPEDYLTYVHRLPLEKYVKPNPALDTILADLPLAKAIFTNASVAHAKRVLALLGVEHHFNTIVDIKAIEYFNKPDPKAFELALNILQARPEECLFLDDSDRNLLQGRTMRMVTVLVGSDSSDAADFAISRIERLPAVMAQLDGRLDGRTGVAHGQ